MRGYFGIGIERSKSEVNVGTLWRSAYNLGASFIFTIGRRYPKQASDTTQSWRHIPLLEYSNVEDFRNHIPFDCIPIAIELTSDAKSIRDFKHPERAVYILGPEDGSISKALQDICKTVICIESKYCLNVAVAGSIIMYDRQVKNAS